MRETLYLDTETTGLRGCYAGGKDEIVELAIVDDAGVPVINTLVRPARLQEWPYAERIHGISPAMVAAAPRLEDFVPDLRHLLRGTTVVIYNAAFDVQFLPHEVFQGCDVQCCMLRYANGGRWPKLTAAAADVGHRWTGAAHRALADTLATRSVWRHLDMQARGAAGASGPSGFTRDPLRT